MEETKARNIRMQNGIPKATFTKIMPIICLNSPISCSTQMVGTIAGGTISPASTMAFTNGFQRELRRCST